MSRVTSVGSLDVLLFAIVASLVRLTAKSLRHLPTIPRRVFIGAANPPTRLSVSALALLRVR